MKFPDISSVETYLNSLINYEHAFPLGGARDRPKLEPTYRAVERLRLSLNLPNCLHIAGTKGKGSVVSFLEAIFRDDLPTLSFTSPHLMSFTERVRWNGKPLSEELWCKAMSEIVPSLSREPAIGLTYFEMTWITFLWIARELRPAVPIVEAGLGGKWDATNVLENSIAVLTPVDYDHTDVLGNTLTEIATDKSGIIKPKVRVVVGRQTVEVIRVYRDITEKQSAEVQFFGDDFRWVAEDKDSFRYEDHLHSLSRLRLASPGTHQRDNAAVAINAAFCVDRDFPFHRIRSRLAECVVPGRQQLLTGIPEVLVDVAHNPISFRALSDTLRSRFANRRINAVIGMMKNKDARTSLASLKGLVQNLYIVELNSPRSYKQADLAEVAAELEMNVICPDSMEEAFLRLHKAGRTDLGLVAGSFYLAGDYLLWRKRAGIA
ncbi:MAG: bifunctional folylpolyglutamate synthase/dihydrofolate synthase [Calditrichota bacterium]